MILIPVGAVFNRTSDGGKSTSHRKGDYRGTREYLIDEDTSHIIRDGLQQRQPEIEVRVIGSEGAPPIGAKDEEILEFLGREAYVLVSSNRSTMIVPLFLKFTINA